MSEFDDLYENLQVHPSAHPEVIQASHWQLSQLYDPSRNPYPNASEMMDTINRAYEVLSDPAPAGHVRPIQEDQESSP